MTEIEWLSSGDPVAMLRLATGRVSLCCGCVWCDNHDGTESMADGQKCCPKCDNAIPEAGYRPITSDRKLRLFVCACLARSDQTLLADTDRFGYFNYGEDGVSIDDPDSVAREWFVEQKQYDPPQAVKANLLREIIGNPFRLVYWIDDPKRHAEFSPRTTPHPSQVPHTKMRRAWLTPTVLAIAQECYDARRFDELGILADALEDAECDNNEILLHLRGEEYCFEERHESGALPDEECDRCEGSGVFPLRGPHVRGCWAVDLVLGRE